MLARRSEMLIRLVDDLTTVRALTSGSLGLELQAVDVADTISSVVADHRELVDSGFSLAVVPGTRVLADPLRLVQVVDNLLTNAIRYGGSNVLVRVELEGDVVAIAVSDDGAGIDPALADSMFEAHARGTTSRLFGGSGLGLAIVRELCTALGGSVTYDGSDGTTFTVRLPAVPDPGVELGEDAARKGHAVSFWQDHGVLVETAARYAAHGLVRGEAVVLALTGPHHVLVAEALEDLGFDVEAARDRGQYLAIDATAVRETLEVDGHVSWERFDATVGAAVAQVDERWARFRAFGEIVDVFWRDGAGHLALELESCWDQLRAQVSFPLYCGYEMAAGQHEVCACHDAVLVA
jgi:anti-sigma regulatory factor (Ser/Thr protein kinase)